MIRRTTRRTARRVLLVAAPVAVLAVLAATAGAAGAAETITGPAQVIDGDSIVVAGRQIRLQGIDAPEWNQTCTAGEKNNKKKWPCGHEATAWLRSRIEGRTVSCAVSGRDAYKRSLATCYRDGEDIGESLVRAGWALAYRRYSTRYVAVEAVAEQAKAGVWRGDFMNPEKWRRR